MLLKEKMNKRSWKELLRELFILLITIGLALGLWWVFLSVFQLIFF